MVGELVPYPWLPQPIPEARVLPGATTALPGMRALGPGPITPGNTTSQRLTQQMIDELLNSGSRPQGPMYGPPRPPIGPMYGPAMPPPIPPVGGLRGMAQSLSARQVLPKLGGFKRAGVGLGVGIGADMLANTIDSDGGILNRALKGAGQGAGLGLLSKNPLVIAGGAIGGGVLGALGALGGKGESGPDFKKIGNLLAQAGVPEADRNQLTALYELDKQLLGEEAAKANLTTHVQQIIAQTQSASAQMAAEQQAQSRMLASQALAGQFFQPFAQDMLQSAQQRHQMINNLLPSLPENYRGVAASQSAASLDNATKMATAYAAQAQMIPAMAAFQDQQSQINGIASQMLQQGIQGTLNPTSAGSSLQDLLAAQVAGK
jgi:hypothetical protein